MSNYSEWQNDQAIGERSMRELHEREARMPKDFAEAVELLREEMGFGPDDEVTTEGMRCDCHGHYVCWNHRVTTFLARISRERSNTRGTR